MDWVHVKKNIENILKDHRFPCYDELPKLAKLLGDLSESYNQIGSSGRSPDTSHLAPKVAFFWPRDIYKVKEAVKELAEAHLLHRGEETSLKILDLGAGLGASTVGLVLSLVESGFKGRIHAFWVDEDPLATKTGLRLLQSLDLKGAQLSVEVITSDVVHFMTHLADDLVYDFILLGQILSELDGELSEEARADRHASWISSLAKKHMSHFGSLILLEPALKERTRHLHRIRERMFGSTSLTLFAPCLHILSCPMLEDAQSWCHEDRQVDLPTFLVPLARAAKLRYQGLTFSYLIIRKDGATLRHLHAREGVMLRAIGDLIVSKGKSEIYACGDPLSLVKAEVQVDAKNSKNFVSDHVVDVVNQKRSQMPLPLHKRSVKLMCTKREASGHNASFFLLKRGDLFWLSGNMPKATKLGPGTHVSSQVNK